MWHVLVPARVTGFVLAVLVDAVAAHRLVDDRSIASRQDGFVGRLDGDEFVVAVRAREAAAELDLARTVRHRLSEPIEVDGQAVGVRASVGAASSPADGCTRSEVLAVADQRMYADKHGATVPRPRRDRAEQQRTADLPGRVAG